MKKMADSSRHVMLGSGLLGSSPGYRPSQQLGFHRPELWWVILLHLYLGTKSNYCMHPCVQLAFSPPKQFGGSCLRARACVCECTGTSSCHGAQVEVRRQLLGISFFFFLSWRQTQVASLGG